MVRGKLKSAGYFMDEISAAIVIITIFFFFLQNEIFYIVIRT